MVLFAMHPSYGLTTNPCGFRIFVYRSHHNGADSIQPHKYFNSRRYNNFIPFYTRTLFLCYGLTSHIMSTDSPSVFNMIIFSFGISVLSYAPGTSKMATYLPLFASMITLVNRYYKDMVGWDNYSLGM